jgi:hypothetical protein
MAITRRELRDPPKSSATFQRRLTVSRSQDPIVVADATRDSLERR